MRVLFSTDVIAPALDNHYRLSSGAHQEKKIYNPCSNHIKVRKKIVKGKKKK